jgi:hypothetical protein
MFVQHQIVYLGNSLQLSLFPQPTVSALDREEYYLPKHYRTNQH